MSQVLERVMLCCIAAIMLHARHADLPICLLFQLVTWIKSLKRLEKLPEFRSWQQAFWQGVTAGVSHRFGMQLTRRPSALALLILPPTPTFPG